MPVLRAKKKNSTLHVFFKIFGAYSKECNESTGVRIRVNGHIKEHETRWSQIGLHQSDPCVWELKISDSNFVLVNMVILTSLTAIYNIDI